MILRFQKPLTELLLDFGDEVLDAVRDHRQLDVEELRDKLLGPLRRRLRQLDSSAASAAARAAQNTSSTAPRDDSGAKGAPAQR